MPSVGGRGKRWCCAQGRCEAAGSAPAPHPDLRSDLPTRGGRSSAPFLSRCGREPSSPPSIGGEVSSEARRSGGSTLACKAGRCLRLVPSYVRSRGLPAGSPTPSRLRRATSPPSGGRGKEPAWGSANVRRMVGQRTSRDARPCMKTAQACGKAPRIRPAVSLPACETGGMHKRAKPHWSVPQRLRTEGWWLVDPPRANPMAIVIPFARKCPPTFRLDTIGRIRS